MILYVKIYKTTNSASQKSSFWYRSLTHESKHGSETILSRTEQNECKSKASSPQAELEAGIRMNFFRIETGKDPSFAQPCED